MQVFNAFFKSIKKHLSSIIIYSVIFITLAILMTSYGSSNSITEYKAQRLNIAVFDHDNSDLSQALYDYLAETQNIISIKEDNENIADNLYYQNISYALFINEGFSNNLTNLENVKQSESVYSYYIDNSIKQYMNILNSYIQSGYTHSEAIDLTKKALSNTANIEMVSDDTKETPAAGIYLFNYLPYILISILLCTLGSVLIIFRDKDLSMRIQCSSMSITKRNFLITGSCLIFAICIWFLFMLVSFIMLKSDTFTVNTLLHVLNSFVFMLVSLSITYLISFYVNTDNALNMVGNILGLGFSFLSGIFIPLDFLGSTAIKIANFLPSYWYVLAYKSAINYSSSNTDLSKYFSYLGLELLFAVAFLATALATSKIKKTA